MRILLMFVTSFALVACVGTACAADDWLDKRFAEDRAKKRAIGRCEMELKKYEMMMTLVPPNVDIGKRNDNSAWFFDSCMKGEGYEYDYKPRFPGISNQSCGELRKKNYGIPETLDACWKPLP